MKDSPWLAFRLAFTKSQWNPFYLGIIVGLLLSLIAVVSLSDDTAGVEEESEVTVQQVKNPL